MPNATYSLYVDWNGDGDFGDAGEDVTSDFISALITRGFASPLARMATTGQATFVLKNLNRTYSPALHANVLPRRQVKFNMTYDSITSTLFRGYLKSIEPQMGQFRSRRVALKCVDAQALLDKHEGPVALQTNVFANDVIQATVAAVYTPPSGVGYDTGINFFPTSGDRWNFDAGLGFEEVVAARKIEDACVSDWGRFFISAFGVPTYHNRHNAPLNATTVLTLNDTMQNMQYSKGEDEVYNVVEVVCHPRATGTVLERVGWISQDKAPRIEANADAVFVLKFSDPATQESIGVLSPVTPVAGTDYTCASDENGSGDDTTASVSAAMTAYGDRAEVTLTNASSNPVYVQSLQVRGYAVRARSPITVTASDATSIATYQRSKLRIDAPLMNGEAEAQRLADYLLSAYKAPNDNVENLTLFANKYDSWLTFARELELEQRVVVSETQTGLSGYVGYVYQITHNITHQSQHRVTFSLETAYNLGGTPFRLGTSALNSGHLLIY